MPQFIQILEDDDERIRRFRLVLETLDPTPQLLEWKSAWEFAANCGPTLSETRLISLDHDLIPAPGRKEDPGDGLDAVCFLVGQILAKPVIVHSSNAAGAERMIAFLNDAEWINERVPPLGDDWIESHWRNAVIRCLSIQPR